MKRTILSTLAVSGLLAAPVAMAYTPATDVPETTITVVGGLSNLTAYQNHEQPFWTKKVPELTDGKVKARSEERRVGKEGRSRWTRYRGKDEQSDLNVAA